MVYLLYMERSNLCRDWHHAPVMPWACCAAIYKAAYRTTRCHHQPLAATQGSVILGSLAQVAATLKLDKSGTGDTVYRPWLHIVVPLLTRSP